MNNEYLVHSFQKLIDRYIKTHDPTHERNFIDMYLVKMKEEEEAADRLGAAKTFSCKHHIIIIIIDTCDSQI